jgi:hypothetical protein
MTAQQAEALAAFLVTLRPGQRAWTKGACIEALTAAAASRTNDTELLTRAAVAAALTASVRTPQVIPMEGKHWDDCGDYSDLPSKQAAWCQTCSHTHIPGGDHIVPDGPALAVVDPEAHAAHAAAAKAALRKTRTYDTAVALSQPLEEGQTP